ncbi:MAG: 16S rRNA (cytidine(1402)-2'-O)-methyltransferase [Actinomycetota bacterium]
MSGRLNLCATPIGNLADASPRLTDTLAAADLVFAEDTRRTGILLREMGIKTPLRSYFTGNEGKRARELARLLEEGRTIALVTDAGTPSISDPGLSAIRVARQVGATISVVPGPSALTAAVAVSGMPSHRFVFEGFLPERGDERAHRLAEIAGERRTVVLFSAANRLLEDLRELHLAVGPRDLCVARELTKAFEEIEFTTASGALAKWSATPVRGEFTLVLAGSEDALPDLDSAMVAVELQMGSGLGMAEAVRSVAADLGLSRRSLYQAMLARSREASPGR